SMVLTVSPTIVEGDVLILDQACFIQTLADDRNERHVDSGRTAAQQCDHWNRALLRARRELQPTWKHGIDFARMFGPHMASWQKGAMKSARSYPTKRKWKICADRLLTASIGKRPGGKASLER